MKNPTRSELIRNRLLECIHNGELCNADLVQIFEHVSAILNLRTITNYASDEHITYNGAKKREKECVFVDGVTFVVKND